MDLAASRFALIVAAAGLALILRCFALVLADTHGSLVAILVAFAVTVLGALFLFRAET